MGLEKNKQKTILVLEASPSDAVNPKSKAEIKALRSVFKHFHGKSEYRLEISQSVSVADIIDDLAMYEPYIIHFIGHSNTKGVCIEDEERKATFLKNEDLELLSKHLTQGVQCVIFNSCESEAQAHILNKTVPVAIGTTASLRPKTAKKYTKAFYSILLASKESNVNGVLYDAYRLACLSIKNKELYTYLGDKDVSTISSLPLNDSCQHIEFFRRERLIFWQQQNNNNPMIFIYFYPHTDPRAISALRITPKQKRLAFASDKQYLQLLLKKLVDTPAEQDIYKLLGSLDFRS